MTDLPDTKPRGLADTSRIEAREEWELDFWSQEFAVTRADLLRAIAKVGESADAVERELQRMAARREEQRERAALVAAPLPAA